MLPLFSVIVIVRWSGSAGPHAIVEPTASKQVMTGGERTSLPRTTDDGLPPAHIVRTSSWAL